MNIRLAEIIETPDFQWLRVYKNANSSIIKCIEDKYKKEDIINTSVLSNKKPRWVVIRDPYERFISGLKYDLSRHEINIKDINIKKLFTPNEHHYINLTSGNINHTVSQFASIMNTQVGHYVDIEDLDLFLKMHFDKSLRLKKNTDETKLDIDKEEIMKYLTFDYYVYNTIKKSPFLWEWQHGRIF
mgnify:CR=1 FL=1|tara:strand:+ start:626 stop:1183 length:558 start_codon:yes stop_codon:yes gene_type:complete